MAFISFTVLYWKLSLIPEDLVFIHCLEVKRPSPVVLREKRLHNSFWAAAFCSSLLERQQSAINPFPF